MVDVAAQPRQVALMVAHQAHPQVADQMAVAGVGDPQCVMVAGEHGLEPGRRLANLLPVKPRPFVDGLVVSRDRRHQARDFRYVLSRAGLVSTAIA